VKGETGFRVSIGIPRALLFYKHAAFWTSFFRELGAEVEYSPPTDRAIVDAGISLAVDESCLPVKLLLGHIQTLIGRVDKIFVPRFEDFSEGEVLCTKMWGLPDIVRNTFSEDVDWLELNFSPTFEGRTHEKAWTEVGRQLTSDRRKLRRAIRESDKVQMRFEKLQLTGLSPEQALSRCRDGETPVEESSEADKAEGSNGRIRVALLGHPYLVWDSFFGKPLIGVLKELGAEIHTIESAPEHVLQELGRELSPTLQWTYNREILGGMEYYLRWGIDGLVMLESFPCGPDALALDLAVRRLKGRAPIIRLVMDDLRSLSGMRTRLESFYDVLEMRKEEKRARR
jgi:predicted nucleotide-binding protein (sugar kinase/HSP70/actin superfamily)